MTELIPGLNAEAKRLADMVRLRQRHEYVARHADSPVVSALLAAHGPQEIGEPAEKVYQECHGCPSFDQSGVEMHHAWPCPTWQTISDATP